MIIGNLYVIAQKYTNPTVMLLCHNSMELQSYLSLKFTAQLSSHVEFYAGSWYIYQTTKSDPVARNSLQHSLTMATRRIVTRRQVADELDCVQALQLGFIKDKDLCQGCRSYFDEVKKRPNRELNYGPKFQRRYKSFYGITVNDHEQKFLTTRKEEICNIPIIHNS